MHSDAAIDFVLSKVSVTLELIARAKKWLDANRSGNTEDLVLNWLREQNLDDRREIDGTSPGLADELTELAKSYSARLAFYQATAELLGEGRILAAYHPSRWEPGVVYSSQGSRGNLNFKGFGCSHPGKIEASPYAVEYPIDVDIFLDGIDCGSLHPGIHEAIELSLNCFRRGLYMPATAMLAAAAEATWSECAAAVANNQSNAKLAGMVTDPHTGIGRIVAETCKTLEHGNARPLLQQAGQSLSQLSDAVIWTTTLRDRRNALHWGKAKGFVATHSDTGVLLMAAPMHLKTLEAVRLAC